MVRYAAHIRSVRGSIPCTAILIGPDIAKGVSREIRARHIE